MDQFQEERSKPRGRATCVRFSQEEYSNIEEDSTSTGKTIPTLLKERYFKSPRPLPLMSNADISKFFGDLGRIANNLNQLARRLNSGIREGFVPQLNELQESVNRLLTFMVGAYCRCKKIS